MREKSDDKNKITFIRDKFQRYYKDSMSKIEFFNLDPEELQKPLTIPKITNKDQIYWVCEECGCSNAYFLPKCKECNSERPGSLYEEYNQVSLTKKANSGKRPISQVITDNWQTVEVIAKKMGINDDNEIKELKIKLKYLVKVNYLIPDTTYTKFKQNNFEMRKT